MAEKLGPPLNIDRYLGKAKDRINLVGVELEGGWIKMPDHRFEPQRDGSVFHRGFNPAHLERTAQIKKVGEIPLPPLSLKDLPAVLKLYYPFYVDASCGMHVHLSTNKAFSYQRLMTNHPHSYPATIVEYIGRWATKEKLPPSHPIWPRLSGDNEYCQHLFQAEEQVKTASKDYDHHRDGHRYTVIGFCWSRYKTVECRLLPMMDTSDQALKAIQEIVHITNGYLAASKEKEPRLKSAIIDGDDEAILERRSFV